MHENRKQETITFKADETLREALDAVPNRSEFIRTAILRALDGACPLCHGTGRLTLEQLEHWRHFSENHKIAECANCHATHLVCAVADEPAHKEPQS